MDKQSLIKQLESLVSESRNPNSVDLDQMSTAELVALFNQEDKTVPEAIEKASEAIVRTIDLAVKTLSKGGRLIYIGAGTSGRLGILDAVECRPTFSVPDGLIIGIIAGGEKAIQHAVEGAEDSTTMSIQDLKDIQFCKDDMLIGIAASGRTPYVISAIKYANSLDAVSACLVNNPDSVMLSMVDSGICVNVGPEVLTGSTRMKSGTSQKLVLNMISTAAMIKLGKVYQNLMVDVNATNDKLVARATRIVMQATDCEQSTAEAMLDECEQSAKTAILAILASIPPEQAKQTLKNTQGHLRNALNTIS